MPLLAIPTTVSQIQDAFRAAMEGITPRQTRAQLSGWKYFSRDHDPTMGARWFRFEWDDAGLTDGGFMWRDGASVDLTCSIVTDYGGIPPQERDAIVHDDHQQLWDVLDRLRNTTNGLRRVRSAGWGEDAGTEDQIQIVHQFTVTYLQVKAS